MGYSKTTFSNWYQAVSNLNNLPKFCLIYGDCEFLKYKTISILKGLENIPVVSLQSKISHDELQTICNADSLFDSGSLYIIEETDSKSIQTVLSILTSSPLGSNSICLILKDKPDKTSEKLLDKSINKILPIGCFTPYENDIPSFIDFCTKLYNISISYKAKNYIQSCFGNDLVLIDNELKKLVMIYTSSPNQDPRAPTTPILIDDSDLLKNLTTQRKDYIFKLRDLFLQKKIPDILLLLEDLLNRGQPTLAILGYIAKHFRTLYNVKVLQHQNKNQSQIASILKMSPYMLKDYLRYSPYFSSFLCKEVLKKIAIIDIQLKTSSCNEYNLLCELVDTYQKNLS